MQLSGVDDVVCAHGVCCICVRGNTCTYIYTHTYRGALTQHSGERASRKLRLSANPSTKSTHLLYAQSGGFLNAGKHGTNEKCIKRSGRSVPRFSTQAGTRLSVPNCEIGAESAAASSPGCERAVAVSAAFARRTRSFARKNSAPRSTSRERLTTPQLQFFVYF
jgi:hypothetical protein